MPSFHFKVARRAVVFLSSWSQRRITSLDIGIALSITKVHQSRTQGSVKGFIPPKKVTKIGLIATAAEYVANLVNVNMWL